MDRRATNDTWLNITFEGLCLFEMDKKSATVHFIDGERAGIGKHVVVLEALKEQVVSSTLERAPDHIIHVAAGTEAWRADPQFEITGPFNNGTDSLEFARSLSDDGESRRELARNGPARSRGSSLELSRLGRQPGHAVWRNRHQQHCSLSRQNEIESRQATESAADRFGRNRRMGIQ